MSDSSEQQRLEGLYERLRLKLLDLSRKNRMLNYSLGVRSQRNTADAFVLNGTGCNNTNNVGPPLVP
jgi:hypothetical protein